jgi:hypothetical protein
MSDWQYIGLHRYHIIGSMLRLETSGPIDVPQANQLVDLLVFLQAQSQACGVLVDVSGGLEVPLQSRQVLAHRAGEGEHPIPIAIIGATLPLRAIVTLLINAVRLVLRREVPISFVKAEADALAWLKPAMQARAATILESKKLAGK